MLALAAVIAVTPATLDATLASGLGPGDDVQLASGTYAHFSLTALVGTADAPIVIEGPADGSAVIAADPGPCCNTIEIESNVSYVVLRNLTIDGGGVDGAFGLDARGGDVHHITVEGCTFLHHDASQQTDAISTKTPTSGWVIRGNHIVGVGTGMYLGNSDGSDAFVGGLIEGNTIEDPIGYDIEIKFQAPHAAVPGSDGSPTTTILRDNVFVKSDRPSPDGDRPNLLVGGFPASGADAGDDYQIYGNLFQHNPRESLLQASGRVSIHDNLFVDTPIAAVRLVDHDLPLERAWVYDNTIWALGAGVSFGNAAPEGSIVAGNLILAGEPLHGPTGDTHDNLTGAPGDAAATFASADDLYPQPGRAAGAALDLTPFASDVEFDVDYDCRPRGANTFRGAYAGEGTNPGRDCGAEPPPPSGPGDMPGASAAGCCSSSGGDAAGAIVFVIVFGFILRTRPSRRRRSA